MPLVHRDSNNSIWPVCSLIMHGYLPVWRCRVVGMTGRCVVCVWHPGGCCNCRSPRTERGWCLPYWVYTRLSPKLTGLSNGWRFGAGRWVWRDGRSAGSIEREERVGTEETKVVVSCY